ncbi:hypothetical protein S7711_09947 [Stachybotrys chartarum IBT 7711]|uniref:Uncharacterized protein n=1 Tax=Stachybotrys chartarum (strain CBS 109288 / IBT 7711) TaxID=1280523 RepID=A0A084ALC4_STACB|nr:hypothetical protein S7711_09947 [Stachybotrys chartarum IBT 7711]
MLQFDVFPEAFGLAPQHPMGRCFCKFDSETTFSAFLDGINSWLNVLPHDDHGSVVVRFGPRAPFPDHFPQRLAEHTWPIPPPLPQSPRPKPSLDHPASIGDGAPIPRPPSPAAPADDTAPEYLPPVFAASLTPTSMARIYDLLHRTRRSRGASTSELTLVEALGAMGLLAQCWLSRDEDPRATLSGHQARRFLEDGTTPTHAPAPFTASSPTSRHTSRRSCGSSALGSAAPSRPPQRHLRSPPSSQTSNQLEAGTFQENQAMSLRAFRDTASTLDMTAPSRWNIAPDGVVLIDVSQVTARDIRSTFSSPTTIHTHDPSTTTTITLHTRIRASIVYPYKIGRSDPPPEMAALIEEIQYRW